MNNKKLWNPSFMIACGANFAMFFAFYTLMPILPMYLGQELGADSAQTGMILSSYVIMALLIRPFAGFFVDTMPRKKLLLTCLMFYMLCFGGYIVAASMTVFLIFRAIHGGVFGIGTVSMNTLAIDIMPSERRGEGIGYFGVTSNLAMAIGPMTSLMIYESTGNFTTLFLIAMGMAVLSLVLATFIKTESRPPVPGVEPISLDRFILIRALPVAAVMSLISISYGMLSTYIALYGSDIMGVASGAGLFFVYFAIGLMVARLTSGKLVNKGHFRLVIITGITILIATYIVFITLHNPYVFYISGFLLGIGYGILSPGFQAMTINLGPHNKRGTANATYFASWDLGIGFGILMGGVITDYSSMTIAFEFGLAMLILALVIYTTKIANYYEKNKLR